MTKTTALACQNLMMALVAQGYDSCPMEGFDQNRVKRILKLNRNAHIVMVLGVGKADHKRVKKNSKVKLFIFVKGIYGDRFRIDDKLVIKVI